MNVEHSSHTTILHLQTIANVGDRTVMKLIELCGQDRLHEIYQWNIQTFLDSGIKQEQAELLVQGLADRSLLIKELRCIEQQNIQVVDWFDDRYPALLREIHVPPAALYCKGNVDVLQQTKMLACVGARKAQRYVQDALSLLVKPLIEDGWVVVSGGALGADTYAHRLSLEMKSPTIVVVGSGLNYVYPTENKVLFDQVVAAGGLIVSCFSMDVFPEPYRFPMRNRIIAGLSQACLVLQAAAKSGALITADFALEQGREVFAVPGSIFDPLSAGCHALIQRGAKLVSSAQDIVDELPAYIIAKEHQTSLLDIQPTVSAVTGLNDLQQSVLQDIVRPCSVDMLLSRHAVTRDVMQDILFCLSLDGYIMQDAAGFWVRV